MINKIGDFFKRIQNLHTKEIFVRTIIKESIKKTTSVDIPVENIVFSGSTASLKGISQAARSAIFIKKHKILEDINSSQDVRKIQDIK